MKTRFLRSAAALPMLFAGPAMAAPPAPAYNWSGFYLGANAGGAWASSNANTTVNCSPTTNPPAYICEPTRGGANAALVSAAASGGIAASAFTGGIEAGYNWQQSNLIYGWETDFDSFNLRASRQARGVLGPGSPEPSAGTVFTAGSSFSTDMLYTLRGRVGMAFSPGWMGFITGGLALTSFRVSNFYNDSFAAPPGGVENSSTNSARAGWTVGGGLEWAIANHWSVKAEYLYLNFGKITTTGFISNNNAAAGYAQGLSTSSDLTANIARAGINYKF